MKQIQTAHSTAMHAGSSRVCAKSGWDKQSRNALIVGYD